MFRVQNLMIHTTHNPKKIHALAAIKKIVWSLEEGAKDKGLLYYIFNLGKSSADIVLLMMLLHNFYGYEDLQSPSSVKSWTGYVLLLADCPYLSCVSKLHAIIATSSIESECLMLQQQLWEILFLSANSN